MFSDLSNTFFAGSKPPPWVHAHHLPRAPTGFKQSLSDIRGNKAKPQHAEAPHWARCRALSLT